MKKSSVKTKLIAIMITVALVPLAVSVLISFYSSKNKHWKMLRMQTLRSPLKNW